MLTARLRAWSVVGTLALACVPAARAQWAVVDVPATVQLIQEVLTARQQLLTLHSQLQQAEKPCSR